MDYPTLVVFHGQGKGNQSKMKSNTLLVIYILGRTGYVQKNNFTWHSAVYY